MIPDGEHKDGPKRPTHPNGPTVLSKVSQRRHIQHKSNRRCEENDLRPVQQTHWVQ